MGNLTEQQTSGLAGEMIESRDKILKHLGTITVPAIAKKFIAKANFVVNKNDDAPVKIAYLGKDFRKWFLKTDFREWFLRKFLRKKEKSILTTSLNYHELLKNSVNGSIIKELGGQAKAPTTLAEIYALMLKQGIERTGGLLVNGWVNVFYVPDVNGRLRAIHLRWRRDGWSIRAFSLENPAGWVAGYRLFSRN